MVAFCYRAAMSQPVKLSDALVLDARLAGEVMARSIAGQVEFWAKLGRAIEPLLLGDRVLALCREANTRPLSECLATIDAPAGRQRVVDYLQTGPFPHYEAHPDQPGLLIRIDAKGERVVGRFIGRRFRAVRGRARR